MSCPLTGDGADEISPSGGSPRKPGSDFFNVPGSQREDRDLGGHRVLSPPFWSLHLQGDPPGVGAGRSSASGPSPAS